jgi:hypothetical protein
MMDQVTLSQLCDWPPGKVAAQPIEILAALAASLAEMKTFVADAEARLNAGLDIRFGHRARQLRAADGKDSGRVRLGDGTFVVVADVPKRIDWDQEKRLPQIPSVLPNRCRIFRVTWMAHGAERMFQTRSVAVRLSEHRVADRFRQLVGQAHRRQLASVGVAEARALALQAAVRLPRQLNALQGDRHAVQHQPDDGEADQPA